MTAKYTVKTGADIFDELKATIPKLKRGEFLGNRLISIETTEDLTGTELAEVEEAFKVSLKKVE